MKYARKRYGEDAIYEAWDEFTLWEDVPPDPKEHLEFDTAFIPWYLFNWIPDNAERDPSEPDLPEAPVAITYREENPDKLDEFQKRFINTICREPYSFYAVIDAVPGRSLTIKDLFLKRIYTVKERSASQMDLKGCIMFTRVVSIDDTSIMVGCAPLVIPSHYHYYFIDLREDWVKEFKKLTPDSLFEMDIEIREIYYEIKEDLDNQKAPELRNTDGDPLAFVTLYYGLKCSPQEAFDRLKKLSLNISDEELLGEAVYEKDGALQEVSFDWLKKGNKRIKDWETTVMGTINIKKNSLSIEVNSIKRSEKLQAEVKKLLKDKAVYKNSLVKSVEKYLEEARNRPETAKERKIREEHEKLNAMPEVRAELQKMAEKHWKTWVDEKIPALGNQTPRQAAKNPVGREKLEALFLEYEGRSSIQSQGEFFPDIPKLRKILGLSK
jgi:hypothetical protein